MQHYKDKDFPTDELFQVYTDHPITFTRTYTVDNLDELESSFVYYLMYDRGQTIRINDIDHIMPKSILESLKVESSKINSIKNFQLIDFSTNRGLKNASPFKNWINNHVADKAAFVKRHLISADETLWTEDKFEDFTKSRASLILNCILTHLK